MKAFVKGLVIIFLGNSMTCLHCAVSCCITPVVNTTGFHFWIKPRCWCNTNESICIPVNRDSAFTKRKSNPSSRLCLLWSWVILGAKLHLHQERSGKKTNFKFSLLLFVYSVLKRFWICTCLCLTRHWRLGRRYVRRLRTQNIRINYSQSSRPLKRPGNRVCHCCRGGETWSRGLSR